MDEIKAVLFDLGETLLNFGKIKKTRLILQGARSSHDYLKEQGQPVGGPGEHGHACCSRQGGFQKAFVEMEQTGLPSFPAAPVAGQNPLGLVPGAAVQADSSSAAL